MVSCAAERLCDEFLSGLKAVRPLRNRSLNVNSVNSQRFRTNRELTQI